ncbi:MAG: hypothetical protein ACREC6_12640 [Hyphomicrobiaceae bacterium]
MTLQISPEAQRAIDRVRKIDPAKPALDRAAVEKALRAQLAALDLSDRPIIWVADAQTGYARVGTAAGVAARTAARTVARHTAWTAAWAATWAAARAATRATAWAALAAAGRRVAGSTSARPTAWEAASTAAKYRAWDAAWDAATVAIWHIPNPSADVLRLVIVRWFGMPPRGAAWAATRAAAVAATLATVVAFVTAFERAFGRMSVDEMTDGAVRQAADKAASGFA